MEEQAATVLISDVPEEKKVAGEKEGSVGKLVKLRAFNLFASKIRDTIKDENPVANGHEIKRIVGQKWAKLGNQDKQEFIDVAQNETDLLGQMPVDPNAPKRRRRRRTKAEIELDDGSGFPKKRRGRPRKNGDAMRGEVSNGAVPSNGDGQPKRRRMRKQGDASGKAVDPAFVGKCVSGTVDGSFDAGYLVTVRVGDTDMVFRGVLFEPSIAMPPNNTNDVAPNVKLVRRNDGIVFPSAGPMHSSSGPASSSKQMLGGPMHSAGTVV
ncbi:hypothetical protein Mapa_011828 [Marchantia paleacea]|nr:hypothetical protein Mapa_011828 [Marchantia paleacea]